MPYRKKFLFNLIAARTPTTLYYIFVYIQFVLLTPLLGRLAKSKFRWVGWLVSPVSVTIFKYIWLLSDNPLNRTVSLLWGLSCLGWFTFYYLGLLLGNGIIDKSYKSRILLILYLTSIVLQMAEGYGWMTLGETNCGTQVKLSAFLSSALFLLMCYNFIKNDDVVFKSKILTYIGDYSFGIYLSHIPVKIVLNRLPIYPDLPYVVNSFVVLILSFTFVYLGKRFCGERISRWMGFA